MKRARKKLTARVTDIIEARLPAEPEKAEIAIEQAEDLYGEIRIENKLSTDRGTEICLKPGDQVDVQIEAEEKSAEKAKS